MKSIIHALLVLLGTSLFAAEPPERPADPIELTALRETWQREKRDAALALDRAYEANLNASKARYQAAGDTEAVAAIDRELSKFQTSTLTGSLLMPREAAVATPARAENGTALPKQKISSQTRKKIQAILEGKIWRVDQGGEGLRWYYFAKHGRLARKSRLTEWVWSGLDGHWRIDDFGTVIATGVGNSAQISIAADGKPSIALNREGVLTLRPLYATELAYPGAGKD